MTTGRDHLNALLENPRFNAWTRTALPSARVLPLAKPSDALRCPLQSARNAAARPVNPRNLDRRAAHGTPAHSMRW